MTKPKSKTKTKLQFNIDKYLETPGVKRKIVRFRTGQPIFSQGDECSAVYYLRTGRVKISVASSSGKEAVIALIHAGAFFGEGCIAGQPTHVATATAMEPTYVAAIQKEEMLRLIQEEREFSQVFLNHMLRRNLRIEEDLLDQLLNESEKRLARALILAARYGKAKAQEEAVVAGISQKTLAEMIGTTRGRVSYFMNKFRRLGFIKYNGELQINSSLLSAVLHD